MSTPTRATPSGPDTPRGESLAHPSALARFALNMPDPWPDRRDDARYCDECGEITNHDGESHRRAEAETPEEY